MKTNSVGDTLWTKTYDSGRNDSQAYSVDIADDGGFIVAGITTSITGADWDALLFKTNSDGELQWIKIFDRGGNENVSSAIQTNDNGYLIAGWTSKDVEYQVGWVTKVDSDGDSLWTIVINDDGLAIAKDLVQNPDSSITIAAGKYSLANDWDFWLLNVKESEPIVINEIMQNPAVVNDTDGEWFEIVNTGTDIIDLNGWIIRDNGTDLHTINESLVILPSEFLVLGSNGNAELNGGVEVDYVYTGISLGNVDDELILVNSSGLIVDSVAWDDGSTFPDPNGASMILLDPSFDNGVGTNWNVSSTAFGAGDFGTPGTPNLIPLLTLEQTEIIFDTTAAGAQSSKLLKIYNRGDTTLTVDSIYTNTNIFYLSSTVPFELIAKDTSYLAIFFAPDIYGVVTDTLFIHSNSFNSQSDTVLLSGFGFLPVSHIGISDSSLSFGNIMVGVSFSQSLTISNIGEDVLVVDTIYTDDSAFRVSLSDTFLNPGDSVVISISFTPNTIGSYSGQIIIESNDPDDPQISVSLSGEGIAPAPDIAVYPESIDFGRVARGDSISRILLIVNEGILDLEIAEVSFSVPNTSPFWTDFTGASLAPGDSDTVMVFVRFDSTDENFEEDVLTIFSDDPDEGSKEILVSAESWKVIRIPNDFATIQEGISNAQEGDTVLVQPGTYVENINFNGKKILLGSLFITAGDTSFIRQTIIDGGGSGNVVVFNSAEDSLSVLSGFTLINGSAIAGPTGPLILKNGGGIYCESASPRLNNLHILNNHATYGGGISLRSNSNPIIEYSLISNNSAEANGGGISIAGDTFLPTKTKPFIKNSNIIYNTAVGHGGGIYSAHAQPYLVNSIVRSNHANRGGGLYYRTIGQDFPNIVQIVNCLVDSNVALTSGGGLETNDNVHVQIINSTFLHNSSMLTGGGIFNGWNSIVQLLNTTLWYNSPEQLYQDASDATLVSYSNVQNGIDGIPDIQNTLYWEEGNIDFNPSFIDDENGDFHLSENSPNLERGIDSIFTFFGQWIYSPLFDIEGNVRPSPAGTRPDIGAFESNFNRPVGVESDLSIPSEYKLSTNFPNPFNPTTTIEYSLPISGDVSLIVYNLLGEEVTRINNGTKPAGNYSVSWDASNFASGIYFYRLQAGDFVQTRKMVLLK